MDNNNMNNQNGNKLSTGAIAAIAMVIIAALGTLGYVTSTQNASKKAKDDAIAMVKKNEDTATKKQEADTMMKKDNSSMSSANSSSSSTMNMDMSKAGIFTTYAPDALTKTEGHKNVIFFSAPWCPTCQATNKDIQANLNNINPKLHILSADFDTSVELRQKYGVTMQHTFVEIDASGNLIKKIGGLATVKDINNFAFPII